MDKKKTYWKWLLDAMAIIAFIATFSPLVIPQNESAPFLFGIPYTMWMGILVSIFFVLITYLASTLNKENDHAD